MEAEYIEYVEARLPWLRRVAYLLCQDWHAADDLVQTTITKLFTHWGKARDAANLDAYTRAVLVRTFIAERRSSWFRRVTLFGKYPDIGVSGVFEMDGSGVLRVGGPSTHEARSGDPQAYVDARMDVRAALADLPPRQRATLVLRYYCDLPVEETARELGCTPGTVKSQTAKGLASLRRALSPIMVEEA